MDDFVTICNGVIQLLKRPYDKAERSVVDPYDLLIKKRRMVKVSVDYKGSLRCELKHELSGAIFCTDAPLDNNGKGESFSPTDLCASALGSCMATIVGMQMERLGHDMTGMRIEVSKEMSKYPPRRISRLTTEIWVPVALNSNEQQKLKLAVKNCPVHHSLSSEIDKPVVFHWK